MTLLQIPTTWLQSLPPSAISVMTGTPITDVQIKAEMERRARAGGV